jgi:hypothetical protein
MRSDNGIDRTGIPAMSAADTECLVNDGDRWRDRFNER